ncbi:hypothetical protein PRZ48_003128 [Zasmidium cellare]|uniref:Uncharacterized protein n=1 Tax=Zasmidium cellare TaxID=395010 RepID=A0ABR0EV74_ZASCE|nr:hypothetical protein PRZ48_003128 [Zasmidium cellare]
MERKQSPPGNEFSAVIEPALKVGAACGGAGFLFGGASGVLRGLPAALSGGLSAIQTFTIGTTFSLCRSGIITAWTVDGRPPAPRDLTKASSVAGGISGGAAGLLFRGRSNILPGAIMFAIFGAAGQAIYNKYTAPRDAQPRENFWKRMSEKSWTPFKVLTNEEYSEMLQERMLKLDVEIAVLDDKVAALKEQQKGEGAKGDAPPDTSASR